MAHTPEPDLAARASPPERTLQLALLEEIEAILGDKKAKGMLSEYFVLQGFGLDLAVFAEGAGGVASCVFFELKAFVGARADGVGFGNGRGRGSQIDLLMLNLSQLNLADAVIRWVVVDGTRSWGTARYAFFDNSRAQAAAMGGVRPGKHNNLRVSALLQNAITWYQLSQEVERFLCRLT